MHDPIQTERSVRLDALAEIDPEALRESTSPRYKFKYVDISCASNGKLTLPSDFIEFADAPSRARKIVRDGDVIVSTVRPNLKAFAFCRLADGPYIASTGFAVLRARESVDAYFLLSALLSDDLSKQIESHAVGSNYPAINSSDIRRLQVPAFDSKTQRAIGIVLATIDTAIEQTEALIEKYQHIKAGLMHDLFTRGVLPNGQLRPPRKQAPELYKETAIGWIPREWQFGTLERFADVQNNLRKPLAYEVREGMKGEYPYYGPTGILDYLNEYLVDGEFCLIGEDGDHFLKFQEWSMTQLVSGRFNVNNHAHLLKGKNRASTQWLRHFFKHRDITFHLTRQGAGRYKLNKRALLCLPIGVPADFEQREISQRLDLVEESLLSQKAVMAKTRRQKLGLMQDLLTGKVAVMVDAQALEVTGG